jgi:hypothetical protein
MKTVKELKALLCDPLKFTYDVGHKIAYPSMDDPVGERFKPEKYQLNSLEQALYYQEVDQLSFYWERFPKITRVALEEDFQSLNRQIEEQLKSHQLTKCALFAVEVLDQIQEPFLKEKIHFYPKTTLTGNIPVVSEKGILVAKKRVKKEDDFKTLLPALLLLSTLDTPIPLKVLLFEDREFSLTKSEASTLLDCLAHLYPIALKQPLKLSNSFKKGYGNYSPISPFFEEIDPVLVADLDRILKELYARF